MDNGTLDANNDATSDPPTPAIDPADGGHEQLEAIEDWTADKVAKWAKAIRGVRSQDAKILLKQAVGGSALLSLTEDKLTRHPYNLPGGPSASLVAAIEKLKSTPRPVVSTYYMVPLDDGLRKRLKDPDNCLLYKMAPDAPHYIYVGVKRVAKVVDTFVNQPPDATQRKNLILVVGSPKSGKTSEAMVVVPHLLEPHISRVVIKEGALLPCRKVYIDCAPLVDADNRSEKVWGLYQRVAEELNVPLAQGVTIDNVDMLAVRRLFRSVAHYTIVTIDEYQMLLANLSAKDKAHVANNLRDVMLDPHSACQFIVTGSTGAALMSSLEASIQNGTSVFKAAGIVCTDLHSAHDDLADVHTLLAHYGRAPPTHPSSDIQSGLGFVNCAAENVVSGLINGGRDAKGAIKEYANRVLNIYHRDYEAVLKHSSALLNRIHDIILGISVRPIGAWQTFVEEISLKNGSHIYLWKEPLFAVYMMLQTKHVDDGRIVWREDFIADFPIFDAVLLVKLIPIVEGKTKIDKASFDSWYQQWPKGAQAELDALVVFLSERQVEYYQRQLQKHPNNQKVQTKASKSPTDWRQDPHWSSQLKQPLELLRLIRNATVPHEESIDGKAIKVGGHLFVSYFGSGSRVKATQFIREAYTFIV